MVHELKIWEVCETKGGTCSCGWQSGDITNDGGKDYFTAFQIHSDFRHHLESQNEERTPIEASPLGIMPQWRWRELRVQGLSEAVARQFQQTGRPNFELIAGWNKEIAVHLEWIRTYKNA